MIGILIWSSFTVLHPYHIGSVEMNYNTSSQTFEVTGRFFMDDLEQSINQNQKQKVFFQRKNHEQKMNTLLENWCQKNFGLKVNGKVLKLHFIGYEEDKESVNVYLESTPMAQPKMVEVGVTALHHIFDDQLNIIHIIVNGKRKSHKLRYPKKYWKVNFMEKVHLEKSNTLFR